MPDPSIITELPRSFMQEFAQEVLGTVPAEKVQAQLREVHIGRVLAAEGSLRTVQGLGQKIGTIPARVFYRWQQEHPGCWEDDAFVQEFFKDNEKLRAKGWTPRANPARHGKTMINGKPV